MSWVTHTHTPSHVEVFWVVTSENLDLNLHHRERLKTSSVTYSQS